MSRPTPDTARCSRTWYTRTGCSPWRATALLLGLLAASACGPKKPAESGHDADAVISGPADDAEAGSAEAARKRRAGRPPMNASATKSFSAGMEAFQRGDLEGARTQFSNAVSADRGAYQAHYALGAVYERMGDDAQAFRSYHASLEIVPDYEPAILELSKYYVRSGRLDQAEEFLASRRARTPDSPAVLTALSEIKSAQKDSQQAQELARQALKKDPDFRPAMVAMARDHYANRRLDLATYTLQAILDGYGPENPPRDKNNVEARYLRAMIYKEQGDRTQAISELRKVIRSRPDMVDARVHLAVFMLEAGNAAGAVPVLEGALNYQPNNVLVHLNLGDAYRLQGRPKPALTQLDWVLKAEPGLAQTHYNIGLVYLFSEKLDGLTPVEATDKAIAAFQKYLEMKPSARAGAGDDADELLKRAKNKKSVLEAMTAQPADGEFE